MPGGDDPVGMVAKFADAVCECADTACVSDAHALYMAYAERAPAPATGADRQGVAEHATRLEACVDRQYAALLAELQTHSDAACACDTHACAVAAQAEFGRRIRREPRPPASVRDKVTALVAPMMACSDQLEP